MKKISIINIVCNAIRAARVIRAPSCRRFGTSQKHQRHLLLVTPEAAEVGASWYSLDKSNVLARVIISFEIRGVIVGNCLVTSMRVV